ESWVQSSAESARWRNRMIRSWLTLTCLLSVTSLVPAESPNTLMPKAIIEGWLLLFDGETTYGWATTGPASVADGALCLSGDQEATATTTTSFARFTLSLEYRLEGVKSLKLSLAGTEIDLPAATAFIKNECVHDEAASRGPIQVRVPAGAKLALRNVKLLPLG